MPLSPLLDAPDHLRRRAVGENRTPSVFVLDADPDLGRRLSASDRLMARRCTIGPLYSLPQGTWRPDSSPGHLGFLILAGALLRQVRLGSRWCTELLGPEDLLRPWDDIEAPEGMTLECTWTALEPVRLAGLDTRFAASAGRWPVLMDELLSRTIRRTRFLTALRALAGIPRLDARLMLLLRLLAERWGRVSRDELTLPLRLTHETIARLAGAQRPPVTTVLGRLTAAGHLRRGAAGGWVLPRQPEGDAGRRWSEIRRGDSEPLIADAPAGNVSQS